MNNTAKYIYLERFFNNGSPTGLTFDVSCSTPTHQWYCPHKFLLPVLMVNANQVNFINKNSWENLFPESNGLVGFPLHPDILKDLKPEFLKQVATISDNHLWAMPTASPRTVFIENSPPFFIKLDYPYILGRFHSKFDGDKLRSGPIISDYLGSQKPQEGIYFLPEISCAEISVLKDNSVSGALLRLFKPLSTSLKKLNFDCIMPAFSLFSQDYFNPHSDLSFLEKILGTSNKEESLFNKVIEPILKSYWNLALNHGLIPEAHSQNFLLAASITKSNIDIVWRDFQGFYRDVEYSNKDFNHSLLGKYHLINKNDKSKKLIIRSFLYDWMLGFYFFNPLIKHCNKRFDIRETKITDLIKESTREKLKESGYKYFPEKKWYSMSLKKPGIKKLDFIENTNPLYR